MRFLISLIMICCSVACAQDQMLWSFIETPQVATSPVPTGWTDELFTNTYLALYVAGTNTTEPVAQDSSPLNQDAKVNLGLVNEPMWIPANATTQYNCYYFDAGDNIFPDNPTGFVSTVGTFMCWFKDTDSGGAASYDFRFVDDLGTTWFMDCRRAMADLQDRWILTCKTNNVTQWYYLSAVDSTDPYLDNEWHMLTVRQPGDGSGITLTVDTNNISLTFNSGSDKDAWWDRFPSLDYVTFKNVQQGYGCRWFFYNICLTDAQVTNRYVETHPVTGDELQQ